MPRNLRRHRARVRDFALLDGFVGLDRRGSLEQPARSAQLEQDDAQRKDWHFVPQDRKGLPLKMMNETQRKAAMELLKSALSQKGYGKATSIMSLELVLQQIEGPNRKWPRDPQLYYVSIFGEPGSKSWGWRFEGHHVSQNFTIANNKVVVDAPAFFGTNPAEVFVEGPQKGLRVLGAEEDLGRTLVKSLNAEQLKKAVYDPKAPGDIISFDKQVASPLEKLGIKASELSASQYQMLTKVIEEYLTNVPEDVAAGRRAKISKAAKADILFAWSGPLDRRDKNWVLNPDAKNGDLQGHYYRIQGPSFLIEYDNTQNNANHIHSVWRDFNGDWGKDLLAEHYRNTPHDSLLSRQIAAR